MKKIKIGKKYFDKTQRRVVTVIREEEYKHQPHVYKTWFVVQNREGFVRNVFSSELKEIIKK